MILKEYIKFGCSVTEWRSEIPRKNNRLKWQEYVDIWQIIVGNLLR